MALSDWDDSDWTTDEEATCSSSCSITSESEDEQLHLENEVSKKPILNSTAKFLRKSERKIGEGLLEKMKQYYDYLKEMMSQAERYIAMDDVSKLEEMNIKSMRDFGLDSDVGFEDTDTDDESHSDSEMDLPTLQYLNISTEL
ncbi:hypothetical protein NPIL_337442 [Nephila pilipes]|uniref:Uncharacterized protein n=1 Tax=Nephila pilipes TaxID=299642 RepID=A0A8X6PYB7_NEPPI|nr:hypothetical protein NPIL_337442 [Nephila pilipes]